MKIDIFSKYEVSIGCSGSYISEENSIPGDIAFSNYKSEGHHIWDGGKLINYIVSLLNDENFMCIVVIEDATISKEDMIDIDFFNPTNGEGHNIKICFKESIEEHIHD